MKRLTLIIAILSLCGPLLSQDALYLRVKNALAEKYPATDLTDKILIVNVWTHEPESRECNKRADEVAAIYRVAKLRGGLKGLVGVTIQRDGSESSAAITLQNDGIKNLMPLDAAVLASDVKTAPRNIVFDSNGKELYRDLPSSGIFNSILQLITR